MSEEYRFFSKGLLKEANKAAHREKRSRCLDPKMVDNLPLDFVYYVVSTFHHKKNEVRLQILMNDKGNTALLDTSVTRFMSLPKIMHFDDGKYEISFSERPYPNGREWQETEIKKPVREQRKFRKEVLLKYGYTCAMCSISETSVLRAAHILGVKDGGPDTIDNGICLCVNHEIAFDNGKIKILPDFNIIAPTGMGVEVDSLKLPLKEEDYPSPIFLREKLDLFAKGNWKK